MHFDPLLSDFYGYSDRLSGREKKALGALRNYLELELAPRVNALWKNEEFPHDVIKGLAELDIYRFAWKETTPYENSAVFRGFIALELGRVDASIATHVGVHNGLAMGSLSLCGSEKQRTEWLTKMASGEVVGAFGLTEPDSGSDAAHGLKTTAHRDGDHWIINGSKRWIGHATFSDITIIWAKNTEDGAVNGFIVPTTTPGYTATKIEGKQSLRIVQNADIALKNVRIPETLRLANATSFSDTARVLKLTRAEVAWSAVGNSIGAYEAALRYSQERHQFGKPIASRQLVQDLLVKTLGNITASLGMVVRLSEMLDEGTQKDEHSALAKAYTTARMRESVAWCREILGGNGILLDHNVARHFADAEALYSYEGTREINTLIVGRKITGISTFV